MLPESKGSFTSSFPICMTFISFPYFIVQTALSFMLNRRGESGHSCLVPRLREQVFSLSALNMMLAVNSSQMHFIRFRKFPLFLVCGEFLS